MKRILFVDNEKIVTRELKKLFNDDQHHYVFFNDGQSVLDFMELNHVDLVVSDIGMPEMNGFELLRTIKAAYPRTTRIAMCQYSNNHIVKKLVEENLAQFYVFKPWQVQEFIQNIHKIINMQQALFTKEMLEKISGMKRLPTLPAMYMNLTQLIVKDAPIEEISLLIEQDPAISATVLRIANSAYYGRRTGNIAGALMNIGLNNLKDIVLTHSVFQCIAEDEKQLETLWQQAAMTNKIMTGIYTECLEKQVPSIHASAGLLHDIGRIVMYVNEPDYRALIMDPEKTDLSISQLEKQHFGVCHQDLGGFLLNSWDLPFAYVEGAMYHHRPTDFRIINRQLLCILHIAHHYAELIGGKRHHEMDETVYELLGIHQETVDAFIKNNCKESI